jgi:hypothetical protein
MSNFKIELKALTRLLWAFTKVIAVLYIAQQAIWAAWVLVG